MRRTALVIITVLAVASGIAGCGLSRPNPTPTTDASVTSVPVGTATASGSSGSSPSPSVSPSPAQIVLAASAIGDLPFGTAESTVTALLTGRLGKPTSTGSGLTCELDPSSHWSKTVIYKGFWVEFEAKDSKRSSPRTLSGWGFQLTRTLPSALAIVDDVPLNLSFKELRARYPGTKTIDLGLEDGTVVIRLPNKLVFYGVKKPEVVHGGDIGVCE